jgi:hypothetical protein
MTRKHYIAIAGIFMHHKRCTESGIPPKNSIENDLADYFESDNPRFDREKFLTACGIEQKCEDGKHYHKEWEQYDHCYINDTVAGKPKE